MGYLTSDGRRGQVTEISGRGDKFWEFPGCELVDDFSVASWLVALLSHRGGEVRAWVPEVFDAYARVFYPLVRSSLRVGDQVDDQDSSMLRWSQVAKRNGWRPHPEMTIQAIARAAPGQVMDPPDVTANDVTLTLPVAQFDALASILARHTQTPDRTLFGLWAGYGNLMVGYAPVPGRQKVHQVPSPRLFDLPTRSYLLYRGPLSSWSVFRNASRRGTRSLVAGRPSMVPGH